MPDPRSNPGPAGVSVPVRPHRAGGPRRPDPVRLARVALAWLARTGDTRSLQLAKDYGPQLAVQRLTNVQEPDISQRPLGDAWGLEIDLLSVARIVLERTKQLRVRAVIPEDDNWPPQRDELGKLSSGASGYRPPPVCLWLRGKASLRQLPARSVVVIGARTATSYGAHVAANPSYRLTQQGWTVVSGGAYGVYAAGHRGALAAAGSTVAALGCGIDCTCTASHIGLFDRIRKHGLLISQWPPVCPPFRFRFALRCGLIAASTRAAVIVGDSPRSQTPGRCARPWRWAGPSWLSPGPVTSVMSAGCHQFLRRYPEARLVTNATDVVTDIERGGGRGRR